MNEWKQEWTEADALAMRESLAQELREVLKVRGFHVPERTSDLIGSIASRLDQLMGERDTLRFERDELRQGVRALQNRLSRYEGPGQ